ncbi:hypothetical protein CR513_10131, partial [Mucuna pruriens]
MPVFATVEGISVGCSFGGEDYTLKAELTRKGRLLADKVKILVVKDKILVEKDKDLAKKDLSLLDQFESNFKCALEQVAIIHLGIDVSEANMYKDIVDGRLVETVPGGRWLTASLKFFLPGRIAGQPPLSNLSHSKYVKKEALRDGMPISTGMTASVSNLPPTFFLGHEALPCLPTLPGHLTVVVRSRLWMIGNAFSANSDKKRCCSLAANLATISSTYTAKSWSIRSLKILSTSLGANATPSNSAAMSPLGRSVQRKENHHEDLNSIRHTPPSSFSRLHLHGGTQYFIGVSLNRGGVGQGLRGRRLLEGPLGLPSHSGGLDPQRLGYRRLIGTNLKNSVGDRLENLKSTSRFVLDSSLSRLNRISPCQERVGILHLSVSRYYIRCMTRSSTNPFYDLDPKIETTLRRLRKARNIVVSNSNSSNSVSNSDNSSLVTNTSNFVEYSSTNNFAEPEQIENNDQTLKELATLDVYPQLEPAQSYELKSGLIHLLLKFHGLIGEDPHKHLKEFHVVCFKMRPQGILEDYIKMKAFLFSLDGVAKDWLYLQPVLFNTWGNMKRMFLEKFFPASRTATIRKEICGIRQHSRETMHEYWESEQLLIQYFYEGLTMMDRSMIDATSGGALMEKTTVAARHLISNMASNSQQFGIRGGS